MISVYVCVCPPFRLISHLSEIFQTCYEYYKSDTTERSLIVTIQDLQRQIL
jgi:hypothetical protein